MLLPEPGFFGPVPGLMTATAWADFPKRNLYLTLRDKLSMLFCDEHFLKVLLPRRRPALSLWHLAVTWEKIKDTKQKRATSRGV